MCMHKSHDLHFGVLSYLSVLASGFVTENSPQGQILLTRPEACMDKFSNALRTMHLLLLPCEEQQTQNHYLDSCHCFFGGGGGGRRGQGASPCQPWISPLMYTCT